MAKSSSAAKFGDCLAQYENLRRSISAGDVVPVYMLMGEEGYFIDSLAELLETKIVGDSDPSLSRILLYGKDTNEGAIMSYARQMPMLGGKQIVIVREAQALRKIEELALYLKAPSQYSVLVLCYKGKTIDGRTSFAKQLSQVGVVFTSARPRDYEIVPWLKNYVEGKGLRIEQKALEMLADHLGTDIAKISNELTKLLTYLPEGTQQITAIHVEDNIGISKDFNIFELTKAISERNLSKALLIADHFRRNPSSNPLVVTTAQIFAHFQRIFILNYHRWAQQKRGIAMPSEMQLCAEMKLASPFFLKEYQTAANNYPNRKVFAIFGYLRECDTRSKGIGTGSMDDGELLRELLLKIMM